MKKIVILLLFIQNILFGQVLVIDRELVSDSLHRNYILSGTFSFNSDKQKNNVTEFNSNFEYDRIFNNNYALISSVKNDLTTNGGIFIQNEGILQLRYRDNDTRKFSPELFLQYQWNGAWGMESRYLEGFNIRQRWIEKSGFDFITATGVFREQETWNWVGVNESLVPSNADIIRKDIFKFNTYIKSAFQIVKNIDFSAISFVQFPLTNDFMKPRWFWDCNFNFNFSKHVNFQLHYDHMYDSNRVVPISDYYYSISTGIQIVL
ncbi:hypothetical protein V7S76_12940 [Aquirufa sp. ROCK2-A2]